jgi:predicted transposase/invertase (TIGR01784 family)
MAKKQQPKIPPTPKQLVRFDWFIKNLLRHKADFEILEGFLCELLKDEIKILKVLEVVESEGNKKNQLDKFNRVDVLVKTSSGERIIIEVQNTKELDYLQRILYGTSKVVTENIIEGQAYKEIKRVISISVVYFELGQGTDYVYRGSLDFIGIHDNDKLQLSQEQIEFFDNKITKVDEIFPRYFLIRAQDFKGDIKDALDEWVYFFKNAQVQGKVKAKGLDKAKKRLDVASLSETDRKDYDKYLESLHDEASYKAQLDFEANKKAQEIVNEKLDEQNEKFAESLIKKGLDDDFIKQTTNLSTEKIQQIKQKIVDKK